MFGEFGPSLEQLQPHNIAMLLPDFVLAVGLFLQNYGLANVPRAREEPMLDPETLWRIRPDINVVPIAPPVRKIGRRGIDVLNARRAGNRGKASVHLFGAKRNIWASSYDPGEGWIGWDEVPSKCPKMKGNFAQRVSAP